MATANTFNQFKADLHNGVHNFGSHTFKGYLTNTAPVATNSVKADIAEIAAGNGYTAGGVTIPVTGSTQTGGAYSATLGTDVTITASGGSVGPFRYVVIYNDTAASDNLVQWYDYGSSITLSDTQTFTLDFGATLRTA